MRTKEDDMTEPSKERVPNWLILWIWQALLGEIYPSIRAIAVSFSREKVLHLRMYLEREPNEDDVENLSCIVTTILANTSSNDQIKEVIDECMHSKLKLGEIDVLGGLIYARREY
jgi:hypothetical protein